MNKVIRWVIHKAVTGVDGLCNFKNPL